MRRLKSPSKGDGARQRFPVGKIMVYLGFLVLVAQTLGLLSTVPPGPSLTPAVNDQQHRALAGGINLFGAAQYAPPMVGTVSMLIVVFCVIFTESFFEALNHMAHDTPFDELITAIENEMMIVGFMAFVLKIIIQLTYFPTLWLISLEYADLLVPMITFSRCFVGIGLIYMSIRMCDHWGKAYHMLHLEVMESYLDRSNSWYQRGRMSWIPISLVNGQMEFRIFHNIFCEEFFIAKGEFAFDEYVHRIFEKFLLRVIGMHEIDWFIICILTLLNWARIVYRLDVNACLTRSGHEVYCVSGDSYTKEDKEFCKCHREASMIDFIICGVAIFIVTLALAIVSRIYEIRVMATRGVHTSDDYALYLDQAEKETSTTHDKNPAKKRFSAESLKDAVSKIKEKIEASKAQEEDRLHIRIINFFLYIWETIECKCFSKKGYEVRRWDLSGRFSRSRIAAGDGAVETFGDKEAGSGGGAEDGTHPASASGGGGDAKAKGGKLAAPGTLTSALSMMTSSSSKSPHFYEQEKLDRLENSTSKGLNQVFLFNKPSWYFDAVAITMMPVSFYMALWVTNFVSSGAYMSDKVAWQVGSIAPGIGAAMLYMYSIRVSSLLMAVTQVDHDAVEEILEQTESAKFLQTEMREKILAKLEEIGNPREELFNLFKSIDDNDSGLLSRNEFQIFLNELNITFSRRKWAQIFAEIDKDGSDELDYEELFLFIFPESNEAKKMEHRRRKEMENRVSRKAEVLISQEKTRLASTSIISSIRHSIVGSKGSFHASNVVLSSLSNSSKTNSSKGSPSAAERGATGKTGPGDGMAIEEVDSLDDEEGGGGRGGTASNTATASGGD